MKAWSWSIVAVGVLLMFPVSSCLNAQSPQPEDQLAQRARQEFQGHKYSEAERDFREITNRTPSNIYGQFFLGQTLFKQQKFADAVGPYEKALELERSEKVLSLDQKRILGDQLAMAYGLSEQLDKARALLEVDIRQDPDYALNYYNLACAYAEMGERNKTFSNLALAFKHKERMLKGEQLPDPRSDSSFKNYLRDEQFKKLMNDLGYK